MEAILPAASSAEAGGKRHRRALHDQLEGPEERLFLAFEMLVKSPTRHACETSNLADSDLAVALIADDFDHCGIDPGSLMVSHLGSGQARPGAQL